jgi:thymidylate synthase (FAD)
MKAEYYNHYGDDDMVVDMARASFSKLAKNYTPEQNARLIAYLAREDHFMPFAHPRITLYTEAPIFVARQDFKHQVGFERSETSRRYIDDLPTFYVPDAWRKRAENVKQGSSEEVVSSMLMADYSGS